MVDWRTPISSFGSGKPKQDPKLGTTVETSLSPGRPSPVEGLPEVGPVAGPAPPALPLPTGGGAGGPGGGAPGEGGGGEGEEVLGDEEPRADFQKYIFANPGSGLWTQKTDVLGCVLQEQPSTISAFL